MEIRVRSSIVCVHAGTLLVFKGVDPTNKKEYWFLPGGKIEQGENPWACAEREAQEETGYRIQAIRESELIKNYTHWWDGVEYSCKTFFYKGVLIEPWAPPGLVEDVSYNMGPEWLPLGQALRTFEYTKEIQDAVSALTRDPS